MKQSKDKHIDILLIIVIIILGFRYIPIPNFLYNNFNFLTEFYLNNNEIYIKVFSIFFLIPWLILKLFKESNIIKNTFFLTMLLLFIFFSSFFQDIANRLFISYNNNIESYSELKSNILGMKVIDNEVYIYKEQGFLGNYQKKLIYKKNFNQLIEKENEGNLWIIKFYGDDWIYSEYGSD